MAGLVALVYLLGGAFVVGLGLLLAALLWLVTRIEIVEKVDGSAGRYATARGVLAVAKVVLVLAIYIAVACAAWFLRGDDVSTTRTMAIAIFALAGLAFLLFRELQESTDVAFNWLIGAEAESKVGERLDTLRGDGWLVLHGYRKDGGGDIDHIVCGPTGAFAIETKSYRFMRRDAGQARGNAWWLKTKLEIPWVTAVLCVAGEPAPRHDDRVWVMSAADLIDWLRAQRDRPVDVDRARSLLLDETPVIRPKGP